MYYLGVKIIAYNDSLAAEPIGQGGQPAHFLVMGKPYCLPYHFLLLQNKKKSTASVFATRFASALSFESHNNQPNLLSSDAFYDLKMRPDPTWEAYHTSDPYRAAGQRRKEREGKGVEDGMGM